jgi:spermidine synthase
MPVTIVLLATVIVLIQAGLILFTLDLNAWTRAFASIHWLACLFFLSGFAALIYQIVWQRVLFAAFGVNIESVTVTVSLFMFGLGVGSLVGGGLSRRFSRHAPQLFLTCEVGIGMFGLISIPLINKVSEAALHGSLLTISLSIYALLSLPTICMGATLPILVEYVHRHYRNVGKSVGVLYFINTLGSATACFLTADILFTFFGLQTAVFAAAVCNLVVALLVFQYTRRIARPDFREQVEKDTASEGEIRHREPVNRVQFLLMMLLSAATGYISLSQEILWFRAISYSTGGKPHVFAYLLGFILLGIACGALLAKRVCETPRVSALQFIALVLGLSGLLYYFSIPLSAWVMMNGAELGLFVCYITAATVALLIGSVFPVVCHHAIRMSASAGFLLSLIYFANILGATIGPVLTGFVLLDSHSLEQNVLVLSIATLLLGGIVGLACRANVFWKLAASVGLIVVLVTLVLIQDSLYAHILEKLQFKTKNSEPYKYVVQTRSGIVAVSPSAPDIVYGGGAYDGRYNVDPIGNANEITRAYMVAALHPEPRDVLEIGLSTGSWARVLADHDAVQTLTSVEINPGYVELIRKYPIVSSLLKDPKVTIHVDDGRRWLNRHPEAKFDFILMNTTWHWRDHVTNLLSAEFLRICQRHLKSGGVLYFNTTSSEDAVFTAATVFKNVARHSNFVAANDTPFTMTSTQKRANLLRFRRDGKPVFDPQVPELRNVLDRLAAADLKDWAPAYRARTDLYCITDDNMASEYKRETRNGSMRKRTGRDT